MSQWGGVLLGVLSVLAGAPQLLTGEPSIFRGVEIPVWTGWMLVAFGLWALFLSIRALLRNRRNQPVVNIDIEEEAARAETEIDAMYLREHGKLPDKPKKVE